MLAALRAYFGSHATSTTFHDPEVQAAVDELRADVRNISKYRNNEKVMQVRRVSGVQEVWRVSGTHSCGCRLCHLPNR